MTFKQMLLTGGVLPAVFFATPALAAAAEDSLGTITVTATRIPTVTIDAPVSVSVLTAETIDDLMVDDIKDLVRFEPGVSVRSQPSRFSAALGSTGRDGNSGFNIRGLEGNRVLIQTDGIRLPDAFAFGAQANGRGDYADLDLLKSVEILRGPASPLYGSDGVAGAVSLTTKDPADLLDKDATIGGRVRLSWAGADENWTKGGALAARSGAVSGLIAYTRRDSGALKNQGINDSANVTRTTPNPTDIDSNAVLAKLVFDVAPGHRLRATYEHNDRTVDTNVLSAVAVPPLAATSTLGLLGHDTSKRDRASLDWRYEGDGLVERASLVGYYQNSRTVQFSAEDRNTAADRTRLNRFDNEIIGTVGELTLKFATGDVGHRVVTGFDASRTLQTGLRDGTIPPAGEAYPIKAFPDTRYTLAGLFVQDEVNFGDGRVLLYPGLRVDYYKLSPRASAQYPLAAPAAQHDGRVSPKLGAIAWVSETFGIYGSYAAGFKAPTPSQVNNGFVNLIQNYRSLANPNLKPESSDSIEGGLRVRHAGLGGVRLNASLTGFQGWFRDFIEQAQIGGTFSPADPGVFQFVNVGKVRIGGVEARVEADLGSGFRIDVATAYARGNRYVGATRTALSTVDPFKLVGGVSYRDPGNRFGGQAIVTHAERKAQSRVSETCSPGCFTPPGFTILDLTAFVRPTRWLTARAGLFNVFDKKYFWWSDVRGLGATSTTLDAYSQPGRNVSLSLIAQF